MMASFIKYSPARSLKTVNRATQQCQITVCCLLLTLADDTVSTATCSIPELQGLLACAVQYWICKTMLDHFGWVAIMGNKVFERTAVGILADPESGRDMQGLMAKASVFHIVKKCEVIQMMLLALANVGVSDVVMMPDRSLMAARVLQENEIHMAIHPPRLPEVHFIEMHLEGSPVDTVRAIEQMVDIGVGAIIVLGGEGTQHLVAQACGATPIVVVSNGANNAFREATAAGTAAGLVATGVVRLAEVSLLNKVLRVEKNHTVQDLALSDLCITHDQWVGTKAPLHSDSFSELFVTFAEADAIGLSSIAGLLHPVGRRSPYGLRLTLVPPSDDVIVISAPIAHGLRTDVGVANVTEIRPREVWHPHASRGVVALDGEREIEFGPSDRVKIWLETEGPTTIDVREVMAQAVENHYFAKFPAQLPQHIVERRDERAVS